MSLIMRLNLTEFSTTLPPEWYQLNTEGGSAVDLTAGVKRSDSNFEISLTEAFDSFSGNSGWDPGEETHGFPAGTWRGRWGAGASGTVRVKALSGAIAPGETYLVEIISHWNVESNITVGGETVTHPATSSTTSEWMPPSEFMAVAEDDGSGNGYIDVNISPVSGEATGMLSALKISTVESAPGPRITFADGDPDTRLCSRDGNFITAADVPIRVSTQRDPRGAPALTGAPTTMSLTDGEAELDLGAADPMPTTGDAIYVEVFDEKATPEDDISRRYVLRMQDGAAAGG